MSHLFIFMAFILLWQLYSPTSSFFEQRILYFYLWPSFKSLFHIKTETRFRMQVRNNAKCIQYNQGKTNLSTIITVSLWWCVPAETSLFYRFFHSSEEQKKAENAHRREAVKYSMVSSFLTEQHCHLQPIVENKVTFTWLIRHVQSNLLKDMTREESVCSFKRPLTSQFHTLTQMGIYASRFMLNSKCKEDFWYFFHFKLKTHLFILALMYF